MVFALRIAQDELEDIKRKYYAVHGVSLLTGWVWKEWAYSKKRNWATLALWLMLWHKYKAWGEGIYGSACSLELMRCAPAIASIIPGTTNYDISSSWLVHSLSETETEYEPGEIKVYSSIYDDFIEIEYTIKAKAVTMTEETHWEDAMYNAREYKAWGAVQPAPTLI
jgi:hypothetical protein